MIVEWVEEAVQRLGIKVERFSERDSHILLDKLTSKFTERRSRQFLWELFKEHVSRRCVDGWSKICDFGEPQPILLLYEREKFIAFQFPSSEAMRAVLAETPGFEFYVTNSRVDFVLCHNHHDFLISIGSSSLWLQGIADDEL